jgi:hypothetical protein
VYDGYAVVGSLEGAAPCIIGGDVTPDSSYNVKHVGVHVLSFGLGS